VLHILEATVARISAVVSKISKVMLQGVYCIVVTEHDNLGLFYIVFQKRPTLSFTVTLTCLHQYA